MTVMSRNRQIVEAYPDGFRKNDHAQILACLTDDTEWTAERERVRRVRSALRSAVPVRRTANGRVPS